MTKIAIPIKDNLLSEVFGDCSSYIIYTVSNKSIVKKTQEFPPQKSILTLSKWIETWGITDVIVHRIDKPLVNFFADTKINLFIGVPIESPEILIEEYLQGTLQSDVTKVFQPESTKI